MFPFVCLGLEVAAIAFARWQVHRRGDFVRSRRIDCPVDHTHTHIYVLGPPGDNAPSHMIRCNRLESGKIVSCTRACLR
jgi:hypothetical protein